MKISRSWIAVAMLCAAATGRAAETPAEKSKSPAPPKPIASDAELMAVINAGAPDGNPAELLKFIKDTEQKRPTANEAMQNTFDMLVQYVYLDAAEKILAKKPNPEQAKAAFGYKIAALQEMAAYASEDEVKTVKSKLESLPGELEKAGLKDLVRPARAAMFQFRLAHLGELGPVQTDQLVDDMEKFFGQGTLDPDDLAMALAAGQALEAANRQQAAARAYTEFGKRFAAGNDKAFAAMAAMMTGAGRRLALVGREMPLWGTSLDGKPLDGKNYKGKVVLVDFWASWCGPCRAEMVNIAENYQAYHARGFDVIGISLDDDPKAVEAVVKQGQHPWTMFLDDPKTRGSEKSLATYYGVFAIPQTVLIGADGKVLAVGVRGPQLHEQLQKLLGPIEEKKGEKAGEKDKAKG